jgi:hypothetical protein
MIDQEKKLNRKNSIKISANRRNVVRRECPSNKLFIAIGFVSAKFTGGKIIFTTVR